MMLVITTGSGNVGAIGEIEHSITLTVFQSARPDTPLEGARIVFTDAHHGTSIELFTNSQGQARYYPSVASYYTILINATGFYDYRYLNTNNLTEFIRFDGQTDVNLRGVFLAQMQPLLIPVDLHLNGIETTEVSVRINYLQGVEQLAYEGVITTDKNILLQPGNYRIAYHGPGLQPNASTFSVQDPTVVDLNLAAATAFSVRTQLNGVSIEGEAYLVSKQKASLGRMIVDPKEIIFDTISFDAYPGEFYLMVSAPGAEAAIFNITLPCEPLAVDLSPSLAQSDSISLRLGDWRNIEVTHTKLRSGGSSDMNLLLSRLPGLRMQLDLSPTVGGNRNGIVDAQEVANYTTIMKQVGPEEMSTTGLFNVDGGEYLSSADYQDYTANTEGLENTFVWSEETYSTELKLTYAATSQFPQEGMKSHLASLYPTYNSSGQGWCYDIQLPQEYVLLGSSVVKVPATIRISGYTDIHIFPPTYVPGYSIPARVALPLVTAKEPSATAAVIISNASFRIDQTTYIVRSGTSVQLSAAGSFDPNNNPLTYIWSFGDGSVVTTNAEMVTHVYADPSLSITATLTVRDVSLHTASAALTIKVDGVDPSPQLLVNGSTPNPIINLDQMAVTQFSAAPSYDLIDDESPPQGIVIRYDWSFGDGSFVNNSRAVSHYYQTPGRFQLTLTITDAAGRTNTTSYAVQVKDTQPPEVIVDIFRAADHAPVSGSAMINDLLLFDGSRSSDPSGIISYLWEFGDGTTSPEVQATHAYTALRTFTGRLTCVDAAGLSAHRTFTLTTYPLPGPDLRIVSLTFLPTAFNEGEQGQMQIEVTNVGSAPAINIMTSFYRVQEGRTLLARGQNITVGGILTDHLDIGQTGQVSASISLPTKGTYQILANITADGELRSTDNELSASLNVQEPAWKNAPIYIVVVLAIAAVFLILYLKLHKKPKKRTGKRPKKRR
ncbi:MAG: PKD domain-containing protein [Methanomassiliicoccales archaeon]